MADFNPINYVGFQDPAAALKLQQQQALAQMLMAQGQKQDDPYAMAGRLVVPQSPLSALAKMGSTIGGAYLQNQSLEKLAKAMQGPTQQDIMGAATNSAISGEGGMGPATREDVANNYQQKLASMLQGNQAPGSNMARYMQMNAMSPGLGTKMYERDTAAAQAAEVEAAKAPYSSGSLVKDANDQYHPVSEFYKAPQAPAAPNMASMLPPSLQAQEMPQPSPQQMPSPQMMPPPPQMVNGQPQAPANMDALLMQNSTNPVNLTDAGGSPINERSSMPTKTQVAGDEAYTKKTNEFYGGLSNDLQKASIDANSKISTYKRIDELLEGIDTGKFQGNINDIKKIGARIGLDLPEGVGQVEAANALAIRLALEAKNDSGNNLMPGSLSNDEGKLLQNMKPGIENSTAGRKIMIDFAVRKLGREQQIAELANDYEDKHGKLDRGFSKEVKSFVTANPLYAEGEFEAKMAEAEKAQQMVEGSLPSAPAGRVAVISPDGKPGTIDAKDLEAFLIAGGKRR